jgi:hypothetical protein
MQEGFGLFELRYVFVQVIACDFRGKLLIDERNVPVPIIDDCLDVFDKRLTSC